jgi:hypothetical protein
VSTLCGDRNMGDADNGCGHDDGKMLVHIYISLFFIFLLCLRLISVCRVYTTQKRQPLRKKLTSIILST